MKNLQDVILLADEKKKYWDKDKIRRVLAILSRAIKPSMVDWEEDDEEWGRIICGGDIIAIICVKLPLIIISSQYEAISKKIDGISCLVFPVRDFDLEKHRVSKSILERVFERKLSENLNYEELSINDIWWATIN